LSDIIIQYPGDVLLVSGVLNMAIEAVDVALLIPVKVVQVEASKLLGALSHACSRPFCTLASISASPIGSNGVIVWGAKCPDETLPLPAPKWRQASEAEVNQVHAMIDKYVKGPLAKLESLNGSENKTQVLALTLSLWGMLSGLNTRLVDYEFKPSSGSKLVVLGVGAEPSIGPGLRERISAVLALSLPSLLSQHPSILQSIVSSIQLLLSNGDQTYQSYRSVATAVGRLSDLYSEPGGLDMVQNSLGPGWKARGSRWPVISVHLRMQEAYALRVSQSSFRSFASSEKPALEVGDLPQPFLSLFSSLSLLSRSVHASVRNQAKTVLLSISLRLPCLARVQLCTALAYLAGIEPPSPPHSSSTPALLHEEEKALLKRISLAATRVVEKPSEELSPAQESEREGKVMGSCAYVLNCLHSWRLVFRSGSLLTATALSLISSRVYDSQSLQPELSNLVLHTLSRFVHPPFLVALRSREMTKGGKWEAEMDDINTLRETLLVLSDPSGPLQNATHRFLFLSNMFLVLLSPFSFAVGEEKGSSVPYLNHLLRLLAPSSSSLELRKLAVSGITFMLSGVVDPHQGSSKSTWRPRSTQAFDGGKEALEQFFSASLGNITHLWNHLVLDHQALEQAEESKSKRGGREGWNSHSQEEKVWRYLDYALSASFGSWPAESSHSALAEGLFVVSHARLITLLSVALADTGSPLSLVPFLEKNTSPEKLQSVMTPTEKCEQALVAEVFGGLVAAGALSDAATFLARAIEHGTLEMNEAWSLSVRYSISFLVSRTSDSQDSMAIAEQHSPRDVSLLGQILSQCLKSPEEFDQLSTQERTKALRVMIQILQEIRKEWGGASTLQPALSHFVSGTIKLSCHLLDSSYSLVLRDLVGPLIAEQVGLAPATQEASELAAHLIASFSRAAKTVSQQRPQGQPNSNGDMMQVESDVQSEQDLSLDIAALGTGLSFVSKGIRAPVGAQGLFLSCLTRLLPSLLASQELAGPDLQKLVTESALSLSLLKYLVMLDDGARDDVASALVKGMKGDHWSERTASILFTQKFWSVQGFALSPSQHSLIEESVQALLADPREEVGAETDPSFLHDSTF
jgi:hypothetical protein